MHEMATGIVMSSTSWPDVRSERGVIYELLSGGNRNNRREGKEKCTAILKDAEMK